MADREREKEREAQRQRDRQEWLAELQWRAHEARAVRKPHPLPCPLLVCV